MLNKKKYNRTDNTWHKIADDNNIWVNWRFNVIKNIILNNKISLKKKMLCADIGSGKGNFSKRLESISSFSVDRFDVDQKNKIFKSRGKFYLHDITIKNKKFKNKYDIIFLLDVLEHIKDDASFIKDCKYYLKKDGILILNVPSIPQLFSKYDVAVGHIRRYNVFTLSKIMKKNKFKIVKMHYWGFMLVPVLFVRTMMLTLSKLNNETIIRKGMDTNNLIIKKIFELLYLVDFYILRFKFYGTSIIGIVKK